MPIRVAAFDVYHTLGEWPANRVKSIEVQQLLERFGIHISYQVFDAARQATLFLDTLKRPIHGWVDFLALIFARMEVKVSTDLLESIAAMYRERSDFEFYEDSLPALTSIKEMGLTTCAFTTLPKFMLGRSAMPIFSKLDHYFDASTVGFAKGDIRYYKRIPELLGVGANEIGCVGDDDLCDCLLPQQAGWQAWKINRKEQSEGSSRVPVVRSLNEFFEELKRGNAS